MLPNSSHKKHPTTFKSIGEQIQKNAVFQHLISNLAVNHKLQILFGQECPLELAGRCQVLGIHKDCLFMQADNASFSTQLRYRSRELLVSLRKYPEFQGVKKIHTRVGYSPLNRTTQSVPKANPISPNAAKSLAESAVGIQDKELREALLKLSGK